MNFLDTADMYGPHTNERLVGRALQGRRAPAIVALNSRAAASAYGFSQVQTTSWTIQSGTGYGDFPGGQKTVVDALIPDYKSLLQLATLDDIQAKWSSLASTVPGAPSLDSVLGQMGPAGQLVGELRNERSTILSQASDFDALRRSFVPVQSGGDVSALPTPWSAVSPTIWMRMMTQGHYGDIGTVQVRVAGSGPATVPLVSSLAYGRCTPAIGSQGNLYACTQPLSFVPQKSAGAN